MLAVSLRRTAVLGALITASLCAALPGRAQAATSSPRLHVEEIVRFPSMDGDLKEGQPTMLAGRLLRPAGTGPHPAVVLLHGCGGLYAKSGRVASRHVWWATTLQQQGYEVLMVDSFGPRGIDQVCTLKERPIRVTVERKRDALAALTFLRSRPEVDGRRVAVMGWSQGRAPRWRPSRRPTRGRPPTATASARRWPSIPAAAAS
ncbi:dienelactone hydrolase family protein [Azospirillum thermophilum]|uniref:dienelactone hydrolase family protein n=1 Tax=Azospirillum thermophilum TaxID=2202148 RepID=UPI001FE63242|nr:hypothetical protein [Azospirillum thermophilum]